MAHQAYERLAEALDRLPNGFPRTSSGIEITLLRRIFTPEQAALAALLTREMEPVEAIAARAGLAVAEARAALMGMARRGMVWFEREGGVSRFRLAPFIVGIYEAQLDVMDHELAHLVEDYLAQGGAAGIMGPEPALHRVIPAQAAVRPEWILPYDDVRAILLRARSFHVRDCICRVQQAQLGRTCRFPVHSCLSFSSRESEPGPDSLTQEQALALLDEMEEVGLVHSVSNVAQGLGYVCNCCGCCCGILRGINEYGIAHSIARANYVAAVDQDTCTACGICAERCQVGAIREGEGAYEVMAERCIGCGLCVTGCPSGAATLSRLPEAETVHPPSDFAAWEEERLRRRGAAS
ncbi:MAG: 4Fe-4S binding protein [Anaerolineae bacterium]|nr:4Fe-4S binding protein [Anaerolineae bacterium]